MKEKRIPFTLEAYLANPDQEVVVGNTHTPARIVCTDYRGDLMIVIIDIMGRGENAYFYTRDGKHSAMFPMPESDLFILQEQEEPSEFELQLLDMMRNALRSLETSPSIDLMGYIQDNSSKLLDLARKELEKDMPKWKKSGCSGYCSQRYRLIYDGMNGGHTVLYDQVGLKEIKVSDLENLPHE